MMRTTPRRRLLCPPHVPLKALWTSSHLALAQGFPGPALPAPVPGLRGSQRPAQERVGAVGNPVTGTVQKRRASSHWTTVTWTWSRSRTTDLGPSSGCCLSPWCLTSGNNLCVILKLRRNFDSVFPKEVFCIFMASTVWESFSILEWVFRGDSIKHGSAWILASSALSVRSLL